MFFLKKVFTKKDQFDAVDVQSHPASKRQKGAGMVDYLALAAAISLATYLLMDYIKTADFRTSVDMVNAVNSGIAEWKRNQDDYENLTMEVLGQRGLFPEKYQDPDDATKYLNPWDGEFATGPKADDNDIYEVKMTNVPSTALYRIEDEFKADAHQITMDADAGTITISYENI